MMKLSTWFGVAVWTVTSGATQSQPNIVILFADDLGWTDISSGSTNGGNGSPYYRTPNIDALAVKGMAFDNAYSNGPNCAPTRAALMSGQHAARTGIYTVGNSNRGQSQNRQLDGAPNTTTLNASVITLAETLKTAGYATGHFGKWHLGNNPTTQGFDTNAGGTTAGSVSGGSSGHFARSNGSWNLPNLPANGIANQFMAERLTDEAVAWMRAKTTPFFCYLTHFSVHTPIQAPASDIAAFNGVTKGQYHKNQTYAGMLKNLDDQIGRVISFLENTTDPRAPNEKLAANTIIVYYSDNGGVGGYTSAGVTGAKEITHQHPLKSGKGSLYDGGIRVPLIVRWDGHIATGSKQSTPVQSVDFYPTLAKLAGATLPNQTFDGEDFSTVLTGQSSGLSRTSLYWHFPAYLQASGSQGTWRTTPVSVIRRGDFKLHFFYETRSWELYDLATDIGENQNIAASRQNLVGSMGLELRSWLVQTNASLPRIKGTGTQVPLPDPPAGKTDTVEWRQRQPANSPPATHSYSMASSGNAVLMFGGMTTTGTSGELWRFDGNWTKLASGPPARARHVAWTDGNRMFVFGGDDGGRLADTWHFDGSSWLQSGPTTAPSARRDSAAVYDTARNRAVLFGGDDGALRADTWEFDGVTWSGVTTAMSPVARRGHRLVFDGRRTLLHGGIDTSGTSLDDTWSWDGVTWTSLASSSVPRSAFAFTWDPVRRRAVVWGGRGGSGMPLGDTWEFDGNAWVERTPAITPLAAADVAAGFDSERTLLFAGSAVTWDYQAKHVASAVPFGRGCAGTSGIPALTAKTSAWVGTVFASELSQLPITPSNAFILIGFSNTRWAGGTLPFSLGGIGASGCDLLVEPVVAVQAIGIAGVARFTLPVPADASLAGLRLFEQGLLFDPLANALQLVVSGGLDVMIGAR